MTDSVKQMMNKKKQLKLNKARMQRKNQSLTRKRKDNNNINKQK